MGKTEEFHIGRLEFELEKTLHHRSRFMEYMRMKEENEKPEGRKFRSLEATYGRDTLEEFDRVIASFQKELDNRDR